MIDKEKRDNNILTDTYISVQDVFEALTEQGFLIALAGESKVQRQYKKNPGTHKGPQKTWDKNPSGYKGLDDPNYGTGIICDWLPKLKSQLVVIDLDTPRPEPPKNVPIDVLKGACEDILKKTYCMETPSGGLHIYLLSKEQPKELQPKINIDYQTNTGKSRGKYVVANYRWDKKGKKKEFYKKLPGSNDKIILVKNGDDVLQDILQKLINSGHFKTAKQEQQEKIADIFKPYIYNRKSTNNFSLAIAGYLRKQGYTETATSQIIKLIFKGTSDISKRVDNVKQTFKRNIRDIEGWQHLKNVLGKEDLDKLSELTKSINSDVKAKILHALSKNKEPSEKFLADYVNSELELYKNLETNHYYERTKSGQFLEIDERRIIEFFNDEFGFNNISSKRCYKVLSHVTRPVRKNYNLIEFNNGILNTETKKFTSNKSSYSDTPKITIPLNWNPEAKPGRIGKIINDILDNDRYPNDKERWLRSVGHAFMSVNRIGKMTMVQGESGTGKSTLTSILKRIFNYSNLPTSTINANERFTLHGLIDKDINIDDDINNGVLKSIGTLNTITTGNGLEVEIKGENRTIKAGNQQIPRLFANGNTLPPVFGEGFERRLLLIRTSNKIDYDIRDELLQNDIETGKYDDDGMEWFIYTAINTYWENMDKPISSKKDEAKMKEDYEFKSYPLKKAIEDMFKDDYTDLENIPVNKVNMCVKKWCKWAYRKGKISKEHKKPSNTQIKRAMDHAGYDQDIIREGDITIRVYKDIVLKDVWEVLLNPNKK